ncbi:MAG: hypothetical protein JXR59_03250 [Desulfuromonadaceae bacterium]|nr:hypothetical protein [Desulfuromonadaceae bacterium]
MRLKTPNTTNREQPLDNEKGFVLILTMVMLAILSILGIMVLNSSDTELSITTNSRMNTDAFIAGELAVQYAEQMVIDNPNDVPEDTNLDLSDETVNPEINNLLPDGITFEASGNEIDFYTGPAPSQLTKNTSADAFQNNIYRTSDPASEGGTDVAHYRVNVNIKNRGRSSARIEDVFINRGGHVY